MNTLTWLLLLFLCEILSSDGGKALVPKFSSPPNHSDSVRMPPISASQVAQAFVKARKAAKTQADFENTLSEKGRVLSKTQITAEARFLGNPNVRSMQMHRSQTFLEEVTRNIMNKHNLTRAQQLYGLQQLRLPEDDEMLKQCQELRQAGDCDPAYKFRTMDGACNNLKHPNWGRSYTCYARILTPAYADGLSMPRMSQSSRPLPNPRLVSQKIRDEKEMHQVFFTHMSMQWGQFLDHDIGQAVSPRAGEAADIFHCCPMMDPKPEPCYPFSLPKDDKFFGIKIKKDCMNFVRSIACSLDCKLGSPRKQINQHTSFIDGSSVYGTYAEQATALRSLTDGLLKVQNTSVGELLPENFNPVHDQCTSAMSNVTCFQAGDSRVNSQPGLTALHTLWVRHHNLVARQLVAAYPSKTDEEIFEEARRIVSAQYQAVTYKEFLPDVLGPDLMKFFKLKQLTSGYTVYDPEVNPSITTEFTSGAYRFGHTLIQNFFAQVNTTGQMEQDLYIRFNMFHPMSLYEGRLGPLLKGMFYQKAQAFDKNFADAMSNHLFEAPGAESGLDLTSINIQRGRDHGLPGYSKLVKFCFNTTVKDFKDLDRFMTRAKRNQLAKMYTSVHDVDFYLAGLSENPMEKSVVGPTFGCTIGLQFGRLKFGDRFYYEHGGQAGSFTPGQLTEIRKTSLGRIICDNSPDIESVTRNVFRPIGPKNPLVSCKSLPVQDLTKWMEL